MPFSELQAQDRAAGALRAALRRGRLHHAYLLGGPEGVGKELNTLREENRRKSAELVEHRGRERSLQETLVAAQRASEDIRESARKEAEITVADAELQAEKIVQGAHQRFLRIVDDINELKRQRVQFEAGLKSLAEGHLRLLEAFREPTKKEEAVPFAAGRKKLGNDEA